jgi:hypothetical protein
MIEIVNRTGREGGCIGKWSRAAGSVFMGSVGLKNIPWRDVPILGDAAARRAGASAETGKVSRLA